ncbi:MAG: ubiquinol-cytochrome c reductase iron-sulfur subunit [Sulfurospirillum sp.]
MLNNRRRKFLKLLPYTMAGVLAYPIGKFIFFSQDTDKEFWISSKNIKDGITKIKKHNIFIYKNADKIEVFDAHCTHMGCILNFYKDKKKFICPCHHSQFTIDGYRIKGPAQRDLDKIAFNIKNNKLFIG